MMDASELALALLGLRERFAGDRETYERAVDLLAEEAGGGVELSGGWEPYRGPRGGRGWRRGEDVVYGEEPGGGGAPGADPGDPGDGHALAPGSAMAKIRSAASAGVDAFRAVGHKAAHLEHVASEFLSSGVDARIRKLPPFWAALAGGVWWTAKLGTKVAFATYLAGQHLAEATARQAGATPGQAARLRKVLTAVDVTGAKVVPLALGAVGLGAFGAGASFVPVGSATYLAYSMARRPLAVLRGARQAVRDVMAARKKTTGKLTGGVTLALEEDDGVRTLLAAIRSHEGEGADRYDALLYAALDSCPSLAEAVEVADRAYASPGGFDMALTEQDEDASSGRALAGFYASLLTALAAAGADVGELLADALEELEGTGWAVARHGDRFLVADESADEGDSEDAAEMALSLGGWTLATSHAVGEVWRGNSGRWFTKRKDNRVVPARNPHGGQGGAKKRVALRHAARPSGRAALEERLVKYRGQAEDAPNRWQAGNASRIAKALVRHHGEAAVTRIEELTEHVEGALDTIKGDDWRAERARGIARARLRELHHALAAIPRPEDLAAQRLGDLKPTMVTARPEHTKPADVEAIPEHLRGFLVSPDGSDHQLQGAAKMVSALDSVGGFLLADGAGAGKTRQMLAVAATYAGRGKKALLVAPAGIIKPDWKHDLISGSVGKDGKAMGVDLLLNKGDKPIQPGEVHVTTYEQLMKVRHLIDKDVVVIFDEAHGLKNAESARSEYGREVAEKAMGVVYGTATPADSAMDLAYLFRTKLFGDEPFDRVKKRLNPDVVGAAEALRNTSEIFDKLTAAGVMVKREISLDGVSATFDHVELSGGDKAALESIAEGATTKERAQVLMRQRFAQERLKIPHAVGAIREELGSGRQVVIFVAGVGAGEGEEKGTAGLLREALARAGVDPAHVAELHGGEGGGGKEVVDAFQRGDAKVLITTPQSGGTGHNLDDVVGDSPRTQIILTAPFSAIDNAQIWGRTHRLTTRSRSKMRYVFADTPVDRWNADLIRGKVRALGAITAGEGHKQDVPEFPQEGPATPDAAWAAGAGGVELAATAEWVRYRGPHGGTGWKSTRSGRVAYQHEMPGSLEHEEEWEGVPVNVGRAGTPATPPGKAATPGGVAAKAAAPPAARSSSATSVEAAARAAVAPPDRPVPRSTASLLAPDVPPLEIKGTGFRGRISAWDVADRLSAESAKQGKLTARDDHAKEVLSDALADETAFALTQDGNAKGWYDATVKKAKTWIYKIYPELENDPDVESIFFSMLAVTSNGMGVKKGFEHTARLYEHYRDTGEIDTDSVVYGPPSVVVNIGLGKVAGLIEDHGLAGAREFMQTPMTGRELESAGYPVPGELPDANLKGANAVGPKIGSFYGNMNGDFSSVTMDRWFMRTVNRMRGTLTDVAPSALKDQAVRLAEAVGAIPREEWAAVGHGQDRDKVLSQAGAIAAGGDLDLAPDLKAWAAARHAHYARTSSEKSKTYGEKTEINMGAKNFDLNVEGLDEVPSGGAERKWIREVVAATQTKLRAKGVDLNNADLQALLWYHEKRLWVKMGYRSSVGGEPMDYAKAAQMLWEKKNAGRSKQHLGAD